MIYEKQGDNGGLRDGEENTRTTNSNENFYLYFIRHKEDSNPMTTIFIQVLYERYRHGRRVLTPRTDSERRVDSGSM